MGIGRLLILGIFIWIAFLLYKRFKLAQVSRIERQKKVKVSTIRQCPVCSVHVPENEAVFKNNAYYCSQAHADETHSRD